MKRFCNLNGELPSLLTITAAASIADGVAVTADGDVATGTDEAIYVSNGTALLGKPVQVEPISQDALYVATAGSTTFTVGTHYKLSTGGKTLAALGSGESSNIVCVKFDSVAKEVYFRFI